MSNLPFGFEHAEESPGFLLWQTTTLWQRLIKKTLTPFDLSHPQFVIMALLLWLESRNIKTTQASLATWSKLDKMTVSQSLKKLVMRDLVQRREDERDTRAKNAFLTEKGRSLVFHLVPQIEKIDAGFFEKAAPADQEALIRILKILTKNSHGL